MNQNVNAGRDRTVSARTVCPQLQSEGYYGGVAVHKPLITQMSAHLRLSVVQKQNKQKNTGDGLQRCGGKKK